MMIINDTGNKEILSEITQSILGSCFEVMNELGPGFLESVYKNALAIALTEKGFKIEIEKRFEIIFRRKKNWPIYRRSNCRKFHYCRIKVLRIINR